jgi:hypothetical protein
MYKDIGLAKAKTRINQACENLHKAAELKEPDSFQLFFAGKPTKGRARKFILAAGVWERADRSVEIRMDAYSEHGDEADQFLQDQFDSVDRAFRLEKAILITQVTNVVNIHDSVVYKANLGEKGQANMNVHDSFVSGKKT